MRYPNKVNGPGERLKVQTIVVGGLSVTVEYKRIQQMRLEVHPPTGGIRLVAPLAMTEDSVRLAVVHKLAWIQKQIKKFEAQPRETTRDMVTGESHYFLGRRYRLQIGHENGSPEVSLKGKGFIKIKVSKSAGRARREQMLMDWYKVRLWELAKPLTEKWEAVIGVKASKWEIRRMKLRWGTCRPEDRRIGLNLELAKAPISSIEYVIVHELVHLLDPSHGKTFQVLMERYLPGWEMEKSRLKDISLRENAQKIARLSSV